jgi:hypothetical protein
VPIEEEEEDLNPITPCILNAVHPPRSVLFELPDKLAA